MTGGTLYQIFKARIGAAKPAPLAPFYGHWQHIPKVHHVLPEGLFPCFKPSCKFEYIHPIPSQAALNSCFILHLLDNVPVVRKEAKLLFWLIDILFIPSLNINRDSTFKVYKKKGKTWQSWGKRRNVPFSLPTDKQQNINTARCVIRNESSQAFSIFFLLS